MHTPTLKIRISSIGSDGYGLTDDDSFWAHNVKPEIARKIETACNTHEDLVDQLKSMVKAFEEGRLNQDHFYTAKEILLKAGVEV